MATILQSGIPRLTPLLKVRTVIRRRVGRPAVRLSANKVESIEDLLALGWIDEEVRVRRHTGQLLAGAERELGATIDEASALLGAVKASMLQKVLLLTKLESVRGLVRQAATNVALCCLTLLIFVHAAWPDAEGTIARRSGRRGERRIEDVRLIEGEGTE